jgi:hypothetical protein
MEAATRKLLTHFGEAVCAQDWTAAEGMLSSGLRAQLDGRLPLLIERSMIPDAPPPHGVLEIDGNSSSIEDLREPSPLFDDKPVERRTLDEFLAGSERFTNALNVPRVELSDEITPENFVQWTNLLLKPDPEIGSDLDFCLEVWCVVIREDDGRRIAHVEPPP